MKVESKLAYNGNMMIIGAVIRDCDEELMVAKCRWMRGCMDSLLMEAKGVLFGLGWVVQLQVGRR